MIRIIPTIHLRLNDPKILAPPATAVFSTISYKYIRTFFDENRPPCLSVWFPAQLRLTFFAEELTCELQGGRNPTQMVHMQTAVGPPTTSSSSTSSGLSPPSSSASRSQVGGGGPTTNSNGGSNPPKPTLTGWSTDDERIFDREAAKINLKWSAKRNKSANNATKESQAAQQRADT